MPKVVRFVHEIVLVNSNWSKEQIRPILRIPQRYLRYVYNCLKLVPFIWNNVPDSPTNVNYQNSPYHKSKYDLKVKKKCYKVREASAIVTCNLRDNERPKKKIKKISRQSYKKARLVHWLHTTYISTQIWMITPLLGFAVFA